jgi:hypothetical protein
VTIHHTPSQAKHDKPATSRLGIKIDLDCEQFGAHDLHDSTVEAQTDLPQAFPGVVVG